MSKEDSDSPEIGREALYREWEGKSVQDILREGQKALFIDLVVAVRNGSASAPEKATLRNLLKDNGLVLGIPPEEAVSDAPPADLPDFAEPDYLN